MEKKLNLQELIIKSLKEHREIQQLTEQLDVIRNLENNPQVAKYISSISDYLQNVPTEKKLEIIANFLSSLGVDDDFDSMKNKISTKFNKRDQEQDEKMKMLGDIGIPDDEDENGLHSPVDVRPVLEGKINLQDLILNVLNETRRKL